MEPKITGTQNNVDFLGRNCMGLDVTNSDQKEKNNL